MTIYCFKCKLSQKGSITVLMSQPERQIFSFLVRPKAKKAHVYKENEQPHSSPLHPQLRLCTNNNNKTIIPQFQFKQFSNASSLKLYSIFLSFFFLFCPHFNFVTQKNSFHVTYMVPTQMTLNQIYNIGKYFFCTTNPQKKEAFPQSLLRVTQIQRRYNKTITVPRSIRIVTPNTK